MSFTQPLGQLRSPVATYASLPITGNVLGDLRISTDTGDAYTWMLSSSTGSLTDWNKVTTASYSELIGAPYSTALDIDNAVKVICGLAINISLLAFNTLTGFGAAVARMFDGMVHQFNSEETGLEQSACENHVQIDSTYYMPNKGDLDINTKMLIHGDGVQGSTTFLDLLRLKLYNHGVITDTVTKKFGTGSLKFDGASSCDLGRLVEGTATAMFQMPMTLDFWMYSNASGIQPIVSNEAYVAEEYYQTSYDAGEVLSVKKDADNKIAVTILSYTNGMMGQEIVSIEVVSASTVSSNAWHHIAIQRNDLGYVEIWIDGILDATSILFQDTSSSQPYFPIVLTLGKLGAAYLDGYLDEIRLSNIARYSTTFTPMTKAYNTATVPAPTPTIVDISSGAKAVTVHGNARVSGTNPLFGNASLYLDGINSYISLADSADWQLAGVIGGFDEFTKLLMHFDGANVATPKVITNNGVTLSTSVKKFGNSSGYFNGASVTTGLSIPYHSNFNFGTGDFTIESWINLDAVPTSGAGAWKNSEICGCYSVGANNGFAFQVQYNTGTWKLHGNDGNNAVEAVISFSLNTWYHVAAVRNVGVVTLYLNGVAIASSSALTAIANPTQPFTVGYDSQAGAYGGYTLHGWIDELRVSKGIARYTSNFTPNTSALLPDANTIGVLIHFDTANIIDAVGGDECGNITTYNSGASVQVGTKKFGSAASVFNGTTGYVSIPSSSDFHFGTGDFTIDFWVKFRAVPSGYTTIVGKAATGSWADIEWYVGTNSTANIVFQASNNGAAGISIVSSTIINTSNFYHVAAIRSGNDFKLFINGILENSVTSAITLSELSSNVKIGAGYGSLYLNGYVEELRISKGIARWTSNFTPPTAAYFASPLLDYTIDLWIDPLQLSDLDTFIIGQNDAWKLTLDGTSNKYLKFSIVNGVSVIAPIALNLETWQHIAVVQKDGIIKLYVDGILGASVTGTSILNGTNLLTIGADSNGEHLFNGFIEEVRISNNARWEAAFTTPDEAYVSDVNTKLLLPLNVQVVPNMVLQSVGYVSNYVPTSARVVIFEEDVDVIEPNVDLVVEISRDGGTTFTPCVIAKDQEFGDGTLNLFTGSLDLQSQPNGELMVWKLTTQNNKDCRIRGISLNWR